MAINNKITATAQKRDVVGRNQPSPSQDSVYSAAGEYALNVSVEANMDSSAGGTQQSCAKRVKSISNRGACRVQVKQFQSGAHASCEHQNQDFMTSASSPPAGKS